MQYVSTRGAAPQIGFCDVLLAGLARDGGLYVPESWPKLEKFRGADVAMTYAQRAASIMAPFVGGEIDQQVFERLCVEAYSTFRNTEVAPLVEIGQNEYLLELFH